MIIELQELLAPIPTIAVLVNYQMRLHAAIDRTNLPDGFWAKWRYVWGLKLASPFVPGDGRECSFKAIDDLVERIFETYSTGAVLEPGRQRGSEKEFLTRLGLAIRVREPESLGFHEQFRAWAVERLRPFDAAYFLPTFGVGFDQIVAWLEALTETLENRLNSWVEEFRTVAADMSGLHEEFRKGRMDIQACREESKRLRIEERIEANGKRGEELHTFALPELTFTLPGDAASRLVHHLTVHPGKGAQQYKFPHDENPLDSMMFVALPNDQVYLLDPAAAYRSSTKYFETALLDQDGLQPRYLKNRDRATETRVKRYMRAVFPNADIYSNYFLSRGEFEKDLLVRLGSTVILVECKNTNVRRFKGTAADLRNYERDFEHSVQYGYEQANEVKQKILGAEETTFLDRKGRPYFSLRRGDIGQFFVLCVTVLPRGPFGTDLSYELKKSPSEPFPLAVNLFDLETICKHLNSPEKFIGYLAAREKLHGHARTGDELNYAGYFYKYGNLDLEDGTFLHDEFSEIFDRQWKRQQGFEVEEPTDRPVTSIIKRDGNRLVIQHGSERPIAQKLGPEFIAVAGKTPIRMKGSERNKPCPCGSKKKMKHCCGVT